MYNNCQFYVLCSSQSLSIEGRQPRLGANVIFNVSTQPINYSRDQGDQKSTIYNVIHSKHSNSILGKYFLEIFLILVPIPKEDPQKQTEADNIQAAWSDERHVPSEAELKRAAELAQEGYLSTVKIMKIVNVDISEIPSDNIRKLASIVTDGLVIVNITPSTQVGAILASVQSSLKGMAIANIDISEISSDQLGKLASIVTDRVIIDNITPSTQLGAILTSVQSKELRLHNMSLSEENTRALVTAMRDQVQDVQLWDVTLDPELLAAYDGQGHCTKLWVWGSADWMRRYEARLRRWAGDRSWAVAGDNGLYLDMERQ